MLLALSACVCGCASEVERYQWNLTHAHICPKARALTHSDLDQIARVVAHATPQVILAISPIRALSASWM